MKTRGIDIRRTIVEIVEDKTGKTKEVRKVCIFPCKINAGITNDHRMIVMERF